MLFILTCSGFVIVIFNCYFVLIVILLLLFLIEFFFSGLINE